MVATPSSVDKADPNTAVQLRVDMTQVALNFAGATAVSFGGVAATAFTINGSGSISVVAPAHAAGQVDVTVTTSSGTSAVSSSDQFTFQTPTPVAGSDDAIAGDVPDAMPHPGATTN